MNLKNTIKFIQGKTFSFETSGLYSYKEMMHTAKIHYVSLKNKKQLIVGVSSNTSQRRMDLIRGVECFLLKYYGLKGTYSTYRNHKKGKIDDVHRISGFVIYVNPKEVFNILVKLT
jgi:hypothetical protein